MKDFFHKKDPKEVYYRWIGIILLGVVIALLFSSHQPAQNLLVNMLIAIVVCALFWNGTMLTTFLVNRIFPPGRNISVTVIAQFVFVGIFVFLIVALISYLHFIVNKKPIEKEEFVENFILSLLVTYFISIFYAAVFFFKEWKANALKAEQLEKANLEARYETLKTQVNPHFIFNSLNTLLTMVECNPHAVRYVESLSDFLRYILQTREKEAALLREELTLVNQYIFLQKSRFGEKLTIHINVPEKYYHYAVPPLVIQMLLENAIKHNVVSKEHNLVIDIYVENDRYLVIENPVLLKKDIETSTGIGLKNIQSRYLILSGKTVLINDENSKFKVSLPLLEIPL